MAYLHQYHRYWFYKISNSLLPGDELEIKYEACGVNTIKGNVKPLAKIPGVGTGSSGQYLARPQTDI